MKRKNYSGSDLSAEFKTFFRREKKRLTEILRKKGCTQIEMGYGFFYFSGFFTSPTGRIYYFSSGDVRQEGYKRLLLRTAKSYKDYTGGSNQFCGVSEKELMDFNLCSLEGK